MVHVFRAPLEGFAATERARGARQRIEAALEAGARGRVTVVRIDRGNRVDLDGQPMFVVLAADVDIPAGDTLETTTDRAVRALERVAAEWWELRTPRRLAVAGAWSVAATVGLALALGSLGWLARESRRRLSELIERRAARLRVAGVRALSATPLHRAVGRLLRALRWAIGGLLVYLWLGVVLTRLPLTRSWGEQLQAFLVDTLVGILSAVAGEVPDLLVVGIIALLARLVVELVRGFFARLEASPVALGWLDADTARPTRALVTAAVWLFAPAMAYPYLPGSETEAFRGLSVLAGVMVSIGGAGLVGQAASGLILTYTRTLRRGEYVRVGDTEGVVSEVGVFATRIRSAAGEELVVPNTVVLASATKNYSRPAPGAAFVLDTSVTIGYDAPWRQVHAMLLEAARRTRGVLADPAPYVLQTALSGFYVEYRLVAYAGADVARPRPEVLGDLHSHVQDVFNEHGVQIMSPHYESDPAAPKLVAPGRWAPPPARAAG
jgi:small-conductance mechanosensitive channel